MKRRDFLQKSLLEKISGVTITGGESKRLPNTLSLVIPGVDGETLLMTERAGVEIDYCPRCRGIWLDRGELDKIIERAGSPESGYQPLQNRYQEKTRPSKKEEKRDRRKENPYASKGSRTRSFLEDIFDFD